MGSSEKKQQMLLCSRAKHLGFTTQPVLALFRGFWLKRLFCKWWGAGSLRGPQKHLRELLVQMWNNLAFHFHELSCYSENAITTPDHRAGLPDSKRFKQMKQSAKTEPFSFQLMMLSSVQSKAELYPFKTPSRRDTGPWVHSGDAPVLKSEFPARN